MPTGLEPELVADSLVLPLSSDSARFFCENLSGDNFLTTLLAGVSCCCVVSDEWSSDAVVVVVFEVLYPGLRGSFDVCLLTAAPPVVALVSCSLFCFFCFVISSSSLSWRFLQGATGAGAVTFGWGTCGTTGCCTGGGAGFGGRSDSAILWMTSELSASLVTPLSGPLLASSVSKTRSLSFTGGCCCCCCVSNRTLFGGASGSSNEVSKCLVNLDRNRDFRSPPQLSSSVWPYALIALCSPNFRPLPKLGHSSSSTWPLNCIVSRWSDLLLIRADPWPWSLWGPPGASVLLEVFPPLRTFWTFDVGKWSSPRLLSVPANVLGSWFVVNFILRPYSPDSYSKFLINSIVFRKISFVSMSSLSCQVTEEPLSASMYFSTNSQLDWMFATSCSKFVRSALSCFSSLPRYRSTSFFRFSVRSFKAFDRRLGKQNIIFRE